MGVRVADQGKRSSCETRQFIGGSEESPVSTAKMWRRDRRSTRRSSRSPISSRARRTRGSRCAPGPDRRPAPLARVISSRCRESSPGSAARPRRCCRSRRARPEPPRRLRSGSRSGGGPSASGRPLVDGRDLDREQEARRPVAAGRQPAVDRPLDVSAAGGTAPARPGTSFDDSSPNQPGWVKSPVPTTVMPLRRAHRRGARGRSPCCVPASISSGCGGRRRRTRRDGKT